MSASSAPRPMLERLDLRAVPAALAAWIGTAGGVARPHDALIAAATLLVAAAMVALVVVRRPSRRASLVAVGLVVMAGFAGAAGARTGAALAHPVVAAAAAGESVTVIVTVTDDPRRTASGAVAVPGRVDEARVAHAQVAGAAGRQVVTGGWVRPSALVVSTARSWLDLVPGQRIRVTAQAVRGERLGGAAVMLRTRGAEPELLGQAPGYQRRALAVRHRFARATGAGMSERAGGLLPALVLGDTTAVSPLTRDRMMAAGLAHLTAVSGANVSIVLAAVLGLARLSRVGPTIGAGAAGLALLAFVVLVRPSASVLRAGAMGSVVLLALVLGRRKQAMPALAVSVFVLLALSPGLALDSGFALSVWATAALVVLAPHWAHTLERRRWPRWLAEPLAIACAAFVVTLPILAAVSGRISWAGVLANVLVAPLIPIITVAGVVAVLVSSVSVAAGSVLVSGLEIPTRAVLAVADRTATLKGAVWQLPTGVTGVVLGFVVATTLLMVSLWRRSGRHRATMDP